MPWFWSAADTRQHANDTNSSTLPSAASQQEATSSSSSSRGQPTTANRTHFSPAQTVAACLITTVTTLGALRIYKRYLRQIPNVGHIKPEDLRTKSIYGYVTSVGDADNFRLFHMPGGRLAGWGWLPSRRLAVDKKALKDKTIHIRIAGVDAPELAHFGRPAQPYSQEALDWLRSQVLNRYVRAMPYRKDQYERVVCSVILRKWLFFKADLGLEMLKAGYATVYEAKFGSEFGSLEEQYRAAEKHAKDRRVGMWQKPSMVGKILGRKESIESPRQYKERMKKEDLAK